MKSKFKLGMAVVMCALFVASFAPEVTKAANPETVAVSVTVSPTITLSTDTNTVAFGSVNPAIPAEADKTLANALTLTVASNANYKLTAKASGDFTGEGNASNKIPIANLKVRENGAGSWIDMTTADQDVVADGTATASATHGIDVRLVTPFSTVPDTYNTTVDFTATQV